mgnify:CR=1 FL=1
MVARAGRRRGGDVSGGDARVSTPAGYEQYEISNVARPGRESRHNLKYWTDGEWLGFGCGAHSTRRAVRWKNLSSTTEYIAAVASGGQLGVERRELTRREALEEALFTGLQADARHRRPCRENPL